MRQFNLMLAKTVLVAVLSISSVQLIAQTLMPIPPQASVYTGATRGFWFEAPVDFMMTGARVPTDASTDDQSIAVIRFNSGPPPFYATTTNDFVVLALHQDISGNAVLPVNAPIYLGDNIGILGSRGNNAINSYGTGNFSTNILGQGVVLARMGMQYDLEYTNPQEIWQENSSISRVEIYYTDLIINSYPWCCDFETTNGNFSSAGTFNSWEFGTPVNTAISSAASGSNAWVTNLDGNHNNNEMSFAESSEFDLTPLVDPWIKFQVNHDFQSGNDGASFQASNDNGATWSTIGSSASTAPWYNTASISGLSSLNSDDGWSGSSGGWVTMKHSILGFSNDTSVIFRFTMGSDGSTVNEGIGFDDIIVAESNDVAITDVFYPDSICGESFTEIQTVLCNVSIEDRFGFDLIVDTNGTTNTISYPDTIPTCGCDTFTAMTINTSQGGYWSFAVEVDNPNDVNPANDTVSGDILTYSIPGGAIISGAGTYCEGSAVELEMTFTGIGPWNLTYSNGTSTNVANGVTSPYTVLVTEGGNYQIIGLTDSTGCAGDSGTFSQGANVIMNPNPQPDLGPDTTLCGDYQLDAGAGVGYTWNTGASSQTLNIYEPGTYAVTVVDANGCEGSDEVDLHVTPLPVITIQDTVLCDGGSVLFNAGGPFMTYLWDDGSTAPIRSVNTQTTVSVTVTDFNNCTNDKSASITATVNNPTPNISSSEGYAPVTLDAGAGYSGYYWNTGQVTQTIQVGAPVQYSCTVTDANGCKGSDTGKPKIWPNSVDEVVAADGVALYPNPAKDMVEVRFSEQSELPTSIQLVDVRGVRISTFTNDSKSTRRTLTLPDHLSAGSYFLRFELDGEVRDVPLMIVE